MTFYLSTSSLDRAIKHLCRYGDTDIFPHLYELAFFEAKNIEIIKVLNELDLDTYNPSSAIEVLAPKNRYSYRIVHQLTALDTVLLLAAVIEIGSKIEDQRISADSIQSFSYRFSDEGEDSIFLKERTYKNWLHAQYDYVKNNQHVGAVIETDISDFYSRINFHRLENLLANAADNHGAVRYIKKTIKKIRMRQSFGLPIGGSASRLLAELALSDIDNALSKGGIFATRFVDDFRIFLDDEQDPSAVLGFLAHHLGTNEGLTLNEAKTKVHSRSAFLNKIKELVTDITQMDEDISLARLASEIYFDDDPDPTDIEQLGTLDLLGFLESEMQEMHYNVGRVRMIFRALKVTRPIESVDFIKENFFQLCVFVKEVVLLMEALNNKYNECFSDFSSIIVSSITSPTVSNVQLIRTWLMELFVRGLVPINAQQLKTIETFSSDLDKRQLHIIRYRMGMDYYFRKNKHMAPYMSRFELPIFIHAASCLPKDEYEIFLSTLRDEFSYATGALYLDWIKKSRNV